MDEGLNNLSRSKNIFVTKSSILGKDGVIFWLLLFSTITNPKGELKKWKIKKVEITNGTIYSSCKIVK